jgi:hypothetical protein
MFNEKWKSEKKTGGIAIKEGVMQRVIEGWIEKKKSGEQLKQPSSEPVCPVALHEIVSKNGGSNEMSLGN